MPNFWLFCQRKIKYAGGQSFRWAKKFQRRAVRHFPVLRRQGEMVYRNAATFFGTAEVGIADNIVVSLTSFPLRINKLHYVISSLLDQSIQPRKLVLYLSLSEFPHRVIPTNLARLTNDRFEVRFIAENLRSHNKLQFALTDFPDTWIATADDDRLYPRNWLARLLVDAARNPQTIICARARRMIVTDGQFVPFRKWPSDTSSNPSFLLYPVGSCGVLYPPGSLNSAVGDRQLIQSLASHDDDTWLKAMSLLQNVPVRVWSEQQQIPALHFRGDVKLWDLNQRGILVDVALQRVFGHFGLTGGMVLDKEADLANRIPL
jgi:hypothetical protein